MNPQYLLASFSKVGMTIELSLRNEKFNREN